MFGVIINRKKTIEKRLKPAIRFLMNKLMIISNKPTISKFRYVLAKCKPVDKMLEMVSEKFAFSPE
jgi:hypothetical protein